jgi:hypothetical protein
MPFEPCPYQQGICEDCGVSQGQKHCGNQKGTFEETAIDYMVANNIKCPKQKEKKKQLKEIFKHAYD